MKPENEPNTRTRREGDYYVVMYIRSEASNHEVYYIRDDSEPTGWQRYQVPDYDWYIVTAIEKLDKLEVNERVALRFDFVLSLRHAIRENFQKGESSRQYDLPACRNTRSAVEKWIKRVWDKYGYISPD